MRSREIPGRLRGQVSTVDLSHNDVDARVDGNDVREQMAFDHFRNGGEIHERRRTNPPPHRLRRAVGYHIVALLTLGALDRDVGFADRWTRTFHHHLEVMDLSLIHISEPTRLGM